MKRSIIVETVRKDKSDTQRLLILSVHPLLLEKSDISIIGGGPTACVPEFFIPHHATCKA